MSFTKMVVAYMAAVFLVCTSVGVWVSLFTEVVVGCIFVFTTWPLAVWAIRREESPA